MEFTNRGGQPAAAPVAPAQHHQPTKQKRPRSKGLRIISSVLLVSVALLVAAVAVYVATGGNKNESSFVKSDKFQAVFLNGGQVYFGKIRNLNSEYVTLDNIYYLRVNQQQTTSAEATESTNAQDISLAKLGCELHGPEDEMIINRDQVSFWENLKDDGQVVKAITEFVKQNPDGQKCAEASSN